MIERVVHLGPIHRDSLGLAARTARTLRAHISLRMRNVKTDWGAISGHAVECDAHLPLVAKWIDTAGRGSHNTLVTGSVLPGVDHSPGSQFGRPPREPRWDRIFFCEF